MGLYTKLFGDESSRFIKIAEKKVLEINALEEEIKKLSDEDFPKKTEELKQRLKDGQTMDDILVEAFALVREAAFRTVGMRHYDVQLIGGMVLHAGKIAEMRTGEGKTLVATLPAYLNALTGEGVHVVTVNDYLAKRDAQWMGQVYSFLGLSVSVVNDQNASFLYKENLDKDLDKERDEIGDFHIFDQYLEACTRKEAYDADITHGTNNQFGFDYLRDNLARSKYGITQRGHAYVLVDEIDSILIDEARTPLVISSAAEGADDSYQKFASIAAGMKADEHYIVDEKLKAVQLTEEGINKAERDLGIENIYTEAGIKSVHHLETAVRAKALFTKDKEYVVENGEVIIVDQSTGRLQPGRRFNMGTHQAIEAKEGVEIQKESKTVATITYQNYFKFYRKLSGMTGTAKTSQEEFHTVYNLDVISIPTHKPIGRIDHNDLIFATEKGKFKAIARKVKEINQKGQPVLIGTISIEKNELLSAYLKGEGVPHTMLNAKKHDSEGELIAQAGRKGSVTIATNMAGRGVDIKLGGDPGSDELYEEIKSIGGLYVLGTERHESRRIDNQLRGRAGRQGDPGETQFFVSAEDDLLRVFGEDRMKNMLTTLGVSEDQPIQHKLVSKSLESAQEKIEGFHFDARKHTLEYDNVMSHQRDTVYGRRKTMLLGDNQEVKDYLMGIYSNEEDQAKILAKEEELGFDLMYNTMRQLALSITDALWLEHLEAMDYSRASVSLRAYGQREPLIEYKREGLRMFKDMEALFLQKLLEFTNLLDPNQLAGPDNKDNEVLEGNKGVKEVTQAINKQFKTSDSMIASGADRGQGTAISDKKYGRNDKVTIVKGSEEKEVKYKKFEEFENDGWTIKD
ncbi:preprotein translocase subunit SecA [Candidatus Parcubacteria bacterium]|nr:preprotein translocase subunit SecA [Candidatus Parcubacteria bacterium]